MDQLKSSNSTGAAQKVELPKRHFSMEFTVGIFAMLGIAAAGYLSVGLGDFEIIGSSRYFVYAEFDNISGLKQGASVEIAGVQIGDVSEIKLEDPSARVTLRLDQAIRIKQDDIASIRTKGIIGDRYVKISRGASEDYIAEWGTITDTESVVDIEDVIGKVVHSLTGDKEKDDAEK